MSYSNEPTNFRSGMRRDGSSYAYPVVPPNVQEYSRPEMDTFVQQYPEKNMMAKSKGYADGMSGKEYNPPANYEDEEVDAYDQGFEQGEIRREEMEEGSEDDYGDEEDEYYGEEDYEGRSLPRTQIPSPMSPYRGETDVF